MSSVNLYRTAYAVEKIVRESGAVPATVAVINGRLRVGELGPLFNVFIKLSCTGIPKR